jgi:hypothetical protein
LGSREEEKKGEEWKKEKGKGGRGRVKRKEVEGGQGRFGVEGE